MQTSVRRRFLSIYQHFQRLERKFSDLNATGLLMRLASGSAWSAVGAVISQLLSLATTLLVVQQLGLTRFGILSAVQSTVGLASILTSLSGGITVAKFVSELRTTNTRAAGEVLALCHLLALGLALLASLPIIFLASQIATHLLNSPSAIGCLRVSAVWLTLTSLDSVQAGAMVAIESFPTRTMVAILRATLAVPAVLLGAIEYGAAGVLLGQSAALLLAYLWGHYSLVTQLKRHHITIHPTSAVRHLRLIIPFSIQSCLSTALSIPANWLATVMLLAGPNGHAHLGAINALAQWRAPICFLPNLLTPVLVPLMQGDQEKRNHSKTLLIFATFISFSVALLVLIGLALFAPYIIGLYREGIPNGTTLLLLSTVAAALSALCSPVGSYLAATDQMSRAMLINGLWAVCLVLFTYVSLSFRHDATSFVLALVLTNVFHCVFSCLAVAR